MFDYVIEGGTVVDGTGGPSRSCDVAIQGDRIAELGDLRGAESKERISAAGRVVAPGFVDVHNHSDGWLLTESNLVPKTSQGFTTEVLMSDGISYAPVNEHTYREWIFYLRALNGLYLRDYTGWQTMGEFGEYADRRSAQNFALQIPYANVRTLVKGFGSAVLTDEERKRIRGEIRRAMDEGAVGLSTGLDYISQCFSTTDELVDACSVMSPYGGVYVTHIRYKLGLLPGIREAIEIAERANVGLHISHLKPDTHENLEPLLQLLDEAGRRIEITFDTYPYFPGSTMLNYLLPYEVWEDGPMAAVAKLNDPIVREHCRRSIDSFELDSDETHIAWTSSKRNSDLQGLTVTEVAERLNRSVPDAILDLLVDENLAVLMVLSGRQDELVDPMLQHGMFMMGSDGIYFPGGAVHPRMFGSAGRLLGRAVRERSLFGLEAAIHKMTGKAASRFGLAERGELSKGYFADCVVFDPETVCDQATFANPQQVCLGFDHVFVNGQLVVDSSRPLSIDLPAPGRFLKFRS